MKSDGLSLVSRIISRSRGWVLNRRIRVVGNAALMSPADRGVWSGSVEDMAQIAGGDETEILPL